MAENNPAVHRANAPGLLCILFLASKNHLPPKQVVPKCLETKPRFFRKSGDRPKPATPKIQEEGRDHRAGLSGMARERKTSAVSSVFWPLSSRHQGSASLWKLQRVLVSKERKEDYSPIPKHGLVSSLGGPGRKTVLVRVITWRAVQCRSTVGSLTPG
mmetsp:Transcript_13597/g.31411  ORF Transcript_13597/g.31411 Transcript_13597/m.31411 type:complete len:158 (+) Transcript_13597:270-743(+)